ncbi:DNA mismatch repair endonuclease MutL [Pseudoalteromonas ardens]|uniref:DNA mismatch repair protein MutL n=1 Tax=Pseudoalteromonas rubra TaxID=43658 RepID=A0A0L0EMF4_9GAMM|nr:DNA mismatch repair endonuclease MutL [Pseudoalteromonas sp. R96]KNC65550.1 DNA mismatch repair protein MutL [Pseudoalteromonas rubra]MDK1313997.1 DNA mismatch repair endonuclease MutL [Pseudoalteromonas sp. R96]
MSIEILPARLANQIAAGEVVERPASVVKELVENSIDAGATRIQIDIERGGHKLIRIRDNGAGIVKDELTLALSRHATSKLKTLDDLECIASLGFRGEALASISSVSRLTLSSKPAEQETAWQAFAEGRDMTVQIQPTAHPNGTTIEVKDLFFNTPARRKFLRTEKTEFSHIDELIKRIALSRFDLALTLTHNQKVIRQFRARPDPYSVERVAQVAGKIFAQQASFVESGHDGLKLYGWVLPVGSSNQTQYTYVNGRMMRDKLILHAIRQAFEETAGAVDTPGFVIYLELDPTQVDVNVHPAKHEVRFHQARLIHDFIVQAVKQVALSDSPELPLSAAEPPLASSVMSDVQEPHSPPVSEQFTSQDARQHQAYRSPLQSDYGSVQDGARTSVPGSGSAAFTPNPGYRSGAKSSNSSGAAKSRQVNVNELYQGMATVADMPQLAPATDEQIKPQRTEVTRFLVLAEGAVLFTQEGELRLGHCRDGLVETWQAQIEQDGTLQGKALLLPVRVNLSAEEIARVMAQESWLTLLGFAIQAHERYVMIKKLPLSLYSLDVPQCLDQVLSACTMQEQTLNAWLNWLQVTTPAGYFYSQHFAAVAEKIIKNARSCAQIEAKAVTIDQSKLSSLSQQEQ